MTAQSLGPASAQPYYLAAGLGGRGAPRSGASPMGEPAYVLPYAAYPQADDGMAAAAAAAAAASAGYQYYAAASAAAMYDAGGSDGDMSGGGYHGRAPNGGNH